LGDFSKNLGLTKPYTHFDGQQHTVYPAKGGKPAYWIPLAKDSRATDQDGSPMRQSDRSSIDTNEEAEQTEMSEFGDNGDDEDELDDDLQLNIKGATVHRRRRKATRGATQ